MNKTLICIFIVFFAPVAFAANLPFSDNFDRYNSVSELRSVGEWLDVNSAFKLVSEGCASGSCLQVTYSGGGFYPAAISLPTKPAEVYARFKFKVDANPQGGIKFFKVFGNGYSQGNYANFTVNYGGAAAESWLSSLCYGDGDGAINDTTVCLRTNGTVGPYGYDDFTFATQLIGPFYATPGKWHTVEIYGRHSTGTTTVNYDGEFKITVDGTVYMHVTNVKNRGSSNSLGYERIAFGDYGNSYAHMTIWFDDIEISSSPLTSVSDGGDSDDGGGTTEPTEPEPSDQNAVVQWSTSNYTVNNEGNKVVVLTINRSNSSSETSSVDWGTFQNTATVNADYVGVAWTTVTFAPGETSKTVHVNINEDLVVEEDENFSVSLSNPVNCVLGDAPVATVKIVDNDSVLPPTVWVVP